MKKLVKVFLLAMFLLNSFQQNTCLGSQQERELIREYLRQVCKPHGQQTLIARVLNVSDSNVSTFISPNSVKKGSKILINFKEKFPDLYKQVLGKVSTVPQYPQTSFLLNASLQPFLTIVNITEDISDEVLKMPLVSVLPDRGPTAIRQAYLSLLEQQQLYKSIKRFQMLNQIYLPKLPLNQIYEKLPNGLIIIKELFTLATPFEIRLYGPDFEGRFSFITKGGLTYECFSFAIHSPEIRFALGKKLLELIGLDLSHGGDCIHASYPGASFNSNKDPWNLVAANPTLNRHVRTALTQRMNLHAYGEINLYEQYRPISQKRKSDHHQFYERWTEDTGYIPTGFIFKAFQGVSTRIYFFPENNPSPKHNPTLSIYEKLYRDAQALNSNATYEMDVIPKLEVHNAARFFHSRIHDETQSSQAKEKEMLEIFFLAINVNPFQSFGDNLNLFKKMKIPFSWNGALGYTQEQVQRLCTAIHGHQEIDADLKPKYPYWNGFKLPVLAEHGNMNWADADEKTIPAYAQGLNRSDISRFNRYASVNLLDQVANSPDSSCRMKLGIIDMYINKNEQEKAGILLNIVFQQIDREGSLGEALWLFELYNKYVMKSTPPNQLNIKPLGNLIEKKKANASLEELLKLSSFSSRFKETSLFINGDINQVTKISSKNSKILKKPYISENKVTKLVSIISSVDHLEELSLQNIIYTTPDYSVVIGIIEDEDGPDTIMDHVSREEYFWKYQKPFNQILSAVEKHSSTLKKLNLRNLGFGSLDEQDNKVFYSHDMSYVLKALQSIKLPQLEELHLTGVINNSEEEALTILARLKDYFPKLKKLHYSLSSGQEEIELDSEKFQRLVNIFRTVVHKEEALENR